MRASDAVEERDLLAAPRAGERKAKRVRTHRRAKGAAKRSAAAKTN